MVYAVPMPKKKKTRRSKKKAAHARTKTPHDLTEIMNIRLSESAVEELDWYIELQVLQGDRKISRPEAARRLLGRALVAIKDADTPKFGRRTHRSPKEEIDDTALQESLTLRITPVLIDRLDKWIKKARKLADNRAIPRPEAARWLIAWAVSKERR